MLYISKEKKDVNDFGFTSYKNISCFHEHVSLLNLVFLLIWSWYDPMSKHEDNEKQMPTIIHARVEESYLMSWDGLVAGLDMQCCEIL